MTLSLLDWYREQRAKVEELFKEENRLEKIVKNSSPSEKYGLEISNYKTGEGTWEYSRGIVRKGNLIVADVKRNYNSFPFCWVEDHPLGHDYLVCGEDYQGQTVIELDTGKRQDYIPALAKMGSGFCWANIDVSEDKKELLVEGCVWAGPFEKVRYDFTNPMELPYKEIKRWKDEE